MVCQLGHGTESQNKFHSCEPCPSSYRHQADDSPVYIQLHDCIQPYCCKLWALANGGELLKWPLPEGIHHTCRMLTRHDPLLISHIIRGPTARESKNRASCMRGLALCRVARDSCLRYSKLIQANALTVKHKDRQNYVTLSTEKPKKCFEHTGEVREEPLGVITKRWVLCILLMYKAVIRMNWSERTSVQT